MFQFEVKARLTVLPQREDCRLRSWTQRAGVNELSLADEARGFYQMMGDFGLFEAVVDHDERSAKDQIIGGAGEEGRGIEQAQRQPPR